MAPTPPDALIFFGATGDLARKKVCPALQAMAKRGGCHKPQPARLRKGQAANSVPATAPRFPADRCGRGP